MRLIIIPTMGTRSLLCRFTSTISAIQILLSFIHFMVLKANTNKVSVLRVSLRVSGFAVLYTSSRGIASDRQCTRLALGHVSLIYF